MDVAWADFGEGKLIRGILVDSAGNVIALQWIVGGPNYEMRVWPLTGPQHLDLIARINDAGFSGWRSADAEVADGTVWVFNVRDSLFSHTVHFNNTFPERAEGLQQYLTNTILPLGQAVPIQFVGEGSEYVQKLRNLH